MFININNVFVSIDREAPPSIIPEMKWNRSKKMTKSEEGMLNAFAHGREAIRFWQWFLL